jgi:uncharacterized RDD family membrane protein YckC
MTDQPFHQPYPPYPSHGVPAQAHDVPAQGYPGPGLGHPYGRPQDPTDVIGRRAGQYLLDGLLLWVPALVLYIGLFVGLVVGIFPTTSPGGGLDSATTDPAQVNLVVAAVNGVLGVVMLLSLAGFWFVFAWWPHRHQGQTPAMGWLGLRVVSVETGGQPTLGALSVRCLLLLVDGAFAGLVGLIVMSNNPRHQRLGDMAASTVVVRTR